MRPVFDGTRDLDWSPLCSSNPGWFAWWDFNRTIQRVGGVEIELRLAIGRSILQHPPFDEAGWKASVTFSFNRVGAIADVSMRKESFSPTPASGLLLIGYGPGRVRGSENGEPTQEASPERLLTRLSDLPDPESWLLELQHASVLDGEESEKQKADRIYISVKRCIIAVLPDISDIRIRRTERRLYADPSIRVEFLSPYGWVVFEQLGVGYQSIASWTIDLLRRLHDRYGDREQPETGPAVVLVDEFDLHLHPKWQLTLMDHLGKIFTNTQFIITAHSPLVVQGAGQDAHLVVLRREEGEDGRARIVADNDPVRVRGWRLDQIVTSDLFGLESARPPEYADLFRERSSLAAKMNRTEEEDLRLKAITQKIETEAPPTLSTDLAELAFRLQEPQKP